MKLTSDLFALLRNFRPRTVKDVRDLGVRLRRIGDGTFRRTYALLDYPDLVMKIPNDKETVERYMDPYGEATGKTPACLQTAKEHIAAEMRNIRIIKKEKKYLVLRRHLPTVYFYDRVTSVLVEKRYRHTWRKGITAEEKAVSELFKDVLMGGKGVGDFALLNIMLDESDRHIMVDLGYIDLSKRKR